MEAEDVQSQRDLANFVRKLLAEYQEAPGAWENSTLPDFLEAMGAWIDSMDGWYADQGKVTPEQPTWDTFAQILRAATVYE